MIAFTRRLLAVTLLLGGLIVSHGTQAAQSYDGCAGFIDSLPAVVATQGVWCLRHDLVTNITGGIAIEIKTNNVTVDCNDYKIGGLSAGAGSASIGITANNRQNSTIRRCGIRGFFQGILISGGAGHLVEDNLLDNNLYVGIYLSGTENSIVRRNRVYDTGGSTIANSSVAITASANIIDNDIAGLFTTLTTAYVEGIFVGDGRGFQVSGNRVTGLTLNGGGIAYGIQVNGNDATVAGNRIASGGASAVSGYGIYGYSATDTFCTGNTVARLTTAIGACQDAGGNASH